MLKFEAVSMVRGFESHLLHKGMFKALFLCAAMAERFKATDSRPVIYDAWALAAKIKYKQK